MVHRGGGLRMAPKGRARIAGGSQEALASGAIYLPECAQINLSTRYRKYGNVSYRTPTHADPVKESRRAKALGICRLPVCFFQRPESNVGQPREPCRAD
jgi:hypothetical protein